MFWGTAPYALSRVAKVCLKTCQVTLAPLLGSRPVGHGCQPATLARAALIGDRQGSSSCERKAAISCTVSTSSVRRRFTLWRPGRGLHRDALRRKGSRKQLNIARSRSFGRVRTRRRRNGEHSDGEPGGGVRGHRPKQNVDQANSSPFSIRFVADGRDLANCQ
jgi:hypothetical protein